jgi:hypothetical protein
MNRIVTLLFTSLALALAPVSAAVAQPDPFAEEEEEGPFEVGGNLKMFALGVVPYQHTLMFDDPLITGFAIGRLKLDAEAGDVVDATIHPILTTTTAGGGAGFGITSIGVGGQRPQAYELSGMLAESQLGGLQVMIDRAMLTIHAPHLDVTVGRQPISFGAAYFFTPMDLVTAFSPATIDREYKPGIDAIRADFYFGETGQITGVAAYAGDWDLDGLIFASHARMNIANVDFGVFAAEAWGDAVGGVDITTDIAGVGLRGEATATFPDNETDGAFLRAVGGADVQLPLNGSLLGEVYLQTLGEDDPAQYLEFIEDNKRFARGELWLMAQMYAAASLSWEMHPLLRPGLAVVLNLQDGSVMASPSLSWSVADEVAVSFGAQIVHGDRPPEIPPLDLLNPDGTPKDADEISALLVPRSEFGLYPNIFFVQTSVYF